jgi:hypothetical protein
MMPWSTGRVEESEPDEMNLPVYSINGPTSGIGMNGLGYEPIRPPILMTQPLACSSSSVRPFLASDTIHGAHGDSRSMYMRRSLNENNGLRTMGSNSDELHTWWHQSVPMDNPRGFQYNSNTNIQWPEGLRYPWEDDFTFDFPPTTIDPSSAPTMQSSDQAHFEGQSVSSQIQVEPHMPVMYYPVLVPVPVDYPMESMLVPHLHSGGSSIQSTHINMHQPVPDSSYRPPSVLLHVWRAMSRFVHHHHHTVSDLDMITNDSTIILKLIDKFTQAFQIYPQPPIPPTDEETQRLHSFLDQVFLSTMLEHIGHPLPFVQSPINVQYRAPPAQPTVEESQYSTPLSHEIPASEQQTIQSQPTHVDPIPMNVYLYDHLIHRDIRPRSDESNNVSKTHPY